MLDRVRRLLGRYLFPLIRGYAREWAKRQVNEELRAVASRIDKLEQERRLSRKTANTVRGAAVNMAKNLHSRIDEGL